MIQNQLFTNTAKLNLSSMIRTYGPPHYPTKTNPVGSLNEDFWAAVIATHNEIIFENRENEFYKYFPPIGIYRLLSSHLLLKQISNDILTASHTWPGYVALAQLRNSRHLSGVLAHIKGYVQKEGAFDQQRNYVHVQNGVIEFSSGSPKLVGFDPKLISRNSIPVCYDPRAKCPKFKGELLAPLAADDVAALQKIFGMYLGGINFLQMIVILQGTAESGKSQLAIVARELIGEHNCAELRVAHLDERFELARFIGKILLIGADVAGDFLSKPGAFRLKGMTGGDLLACERKFSNALFYIAGLFNVLVTCNSRLIVKIDGDRGAWARRLLIFLYEQRKHTKNIPNFGHHLIETEGSGILNWALEGLLALKDEVANHGTLVLTPEQKKRTTALLDESEGVLHFIREHIKPDPNDDITTDELIEKYAVYCAHPDRGWYPNRRLIERQLPNIMLQMFQAVSSNSILRNGKKLRGYRNVTYVP